MEEFLAESAYAVVALAGVLFGAMIACFINHLITARENRSRIGEKLFDKKLEAYENLIDITNVIRSMVFLGGEDQKKELKRCPLIMQSRRNMDDFLSELMRLQTKADSWLSATVKREVTLFLDYFVNLYEQSHASSDEALKEAGVLIRTDFIDFAARLEGCAHDFFNKDLMKLKFRGDRGRHKYPRERTLDELGKTEFLKQKQKVMDILR
jgi:hypothetical protein